MTFAASVPAQTNSNAIILVNELTYVSKIGEGAFGEVWKGLWKDSINVAIKKIKGVTKSVIDQAKQEAQLLM